MRDWTRANAFHDGLPRCELSASLLQGCHIPFQVLAPKLFETIETYPNPFRLVKHPRKQIRPERKVVVRFRFLLAQPSVQAAHRRYCFGVSLAELGL